MIALSCLACRTELTTLALTEDIAARAANSGETCCAAHESPAGRLDLITPEVTAVHRIGETVTSGAPPAATHPDDLPTTYKRRRKVRPGKSRPSLLSGVPAFVARRWAVGR